MLTRRVRLPWVWALWLGLYALTLWVLVWANEALRLRPSHSVILFILLVAGGSISGGRPLAAVLTIGGYLAVDYLFIPPLNQLGSPKDQDGVVLVGFIVTGFVLGELVTQLRRAAELARLRASEIERLTAERVRLEREAAALSGMRETEALYAALLASVAHDLRTPLAVLRLLSDPHHADAPEHTLPRIRQQVDQLGAFVASLGRIGALGATADRFQTGAHDLGSVVDQALGTVAPLMGERIPERTDRTSWMVTCDPLLTHHVLVNLLENASRYAPAGSPIDVAVRRAGANTHVDVLDRGPGLTAAEAELVFAPRARGSAAAGTAGSGMGLAIARTFARAQGGDVTYRPREGGGAVFTVALPTARTAATPR
ncbi:MAG: DUF4118 domain-containing protein [Gemmatimonadetes bacterium]|nr:DUF4118 domain-containing protein [Gemmatimonadota bacterium]